MNFWTERDAVIDDDPGAVVAERRTRLGKPSASRAMAALRGAATMETWR